MFLNDKNVSFFSGRLSSCLNRAQFKADTVMAAFSRISYPACIQALLFKNK